jgi:hypothetical protein
VQRVIISSQKEGGRESEVRERERERETKLSLARVLYTKREGVLQQQHHAAKI